MDGQKFLIEICKQLTAEPLLWCVYDGDVTHKHLRQQFAKDVEDPKFQGKLLAFAHLHLNMFEIVLAEAPGRRNLTRTITRAYGSGIWTTRSRAQD
jgi:hypothetical protein